MAHNNIGVALFDQGRLEEAMASYREALRLKPDYALAHNNLGIALKTQGRLEEATASYREALRLNPKYVEAHSNLETLSGRKDAWMRQWQAAEKPSASDRIMPKAQAGDLGIALAEQGRLEEAVASYREALRLKPNFADAHSNLVFTLNFCPGYDARTIYEEHCRWNQVHAEPLAKFILPHDNDPAPDRRVRVGYVSPDFSMPRGRKVPAAAPGGARSRDI